MIRGFSAFFRGLSFVREHSLTRYVVLPSLLSLAVGLLIMAVAYFWLAANLVGWVDALIGLLAGWLGFTYDGLPGFVTVFLRVLTFFIAFVVQLILYRTVASVLVIPFLGPLLLEVERIVRGQAIEVPLGQDVRNTLRGLWVSIWLALVGLFALLVSLFVGPLQIPLNASVQSYVLGRGAFDYVFEKRAERLAERRPLIRRYRLEIVGLGLAFFLALLVPVLGVLVAPVACTVGAALIFHEDEAAAERTP